MMRRALALATVLMLLATSVRAELKYTMKLEARDSAVAASAPQNPMLGMLGGMVLGMIAPAGGVEMTVVVGERGVRVDYSKAYVMVPAGGAMLIAPDNSTVVLDPAKKTYWKTAAVDTSALAGQATASVRRTGEFTTIAGVRAERATVEIRLPLPMPQGIPGFPSELTMTGETWVAEQFKKYAGMSRALSSAVGAMGLDQMAALGLPLRSIMRSDLFGGKEVESIVTSIGEVSVPATTFQIPAGYTEVPAPAMGMPMGMGQTGR